MRRQKWTFPGRVPLELQACVQSVEDAPLECGDVVGVPGPRAAGSVEGKGVAVREPCRLEVVQVDGAKEVGQVLGTVAVALAFVAQRKFGDRRAEPVRTIRRVVQEIREQVQRVACGAGRVEGARLSLEELRVARRAIELAPCGNRRGQPRGNQDKKGSKRGAHQGV